MIIIFLHPSMLIKGHILFNVPWKLFVHQVQIVCSSIFIMLTMIVSNKKKSPTLGLHIFFDSWPYWKILDVQGDGEQIFLDIKIGWTTICMGVRGFSMLNCLVIGYSTT
jgi:hypothetical protein